MGRYYSKAIIFGVILFLVSAACSKSGEYKLRPARATEIGMQAICPVTNNVFNVSKDTKAVDYKGKTYFLCCPECSVDFKKKLGLLAGNNAISPAPEMNGMGKNAGGKEIAYWTCPMHPQVKENGPGKCPICSMDLVPVYKKESGRITVEPAKVKLLGLKSQPARFEQINKTVRLPAKVAYDNDLYVAQQEYLLSYKNSSSISRIIDATKFRLSLLGYTDNAIKELEQQGKPDNTLLYPGDKAWMFADIYEGDLESIKPGKKVTAVVDAFPNVKFHGKVIYIEPAINPETRSARARILADNTGNLLKIEMFANIDLKTSHGSALAVPKTAVIDTGLRKVVYIDYGNGEYEPRDVKTGFAGDDYVEITSGLKKGDLVVTEGNFMLDSESQLRCPGKSG